MPRDPSSRSSGDPPDLETTPVQSAANHHIVLVHAFVDIDHPECHDALGNVRQLRFHLFQRLAQNPFVADITARRENRHYARW